MEDFKHSEAKTNLKLKARIVLMFGSQSDFAAKLGMHEARVSQVVRGRRPINMKTRKAWAKALGVKVNDIF